MSVCVLTDAVVNHMIRLPLTDDLRPVCWLAMSCVCLQSLLKYIESEALRIPPESRNCVTQSYAVMAATSKHRTRHRYAKCGCA